MATKAAAQMNPTTKKEGAAQIPKNLFAQIEKERDAIIKLCAEYQKNKDDKTANKINELNLHMHAKISVLSENMKPVDVKELEKIQEQANNGVEQAAKAHSMKVDYVDIRNVDVTANGVTKKLHKHLNDALEKATDSESFVSLLPTQVSKALTKINLDKDILLNGDTDLELKGLLELNDIHRGSEKVTNPKTNPITENVRLSEAEKQKLNDIVKSTNDQKLVNSIVNSPDFNSALTKDTVMELLTHKNDKISKLVAESPVLKILSNNELVTLLNKGTINGKDASKEVIEGVFSNPDIVNAIGESQFKKKGITVPRTQDIIETIAAEKIFSIFKSASQGKPSTLAGGKYTGEAIKGLAKNKKAMEVLLKNNHDIFKLFDDSVTKLNSGYNKKGFVLFNAVSFVNGIRESDTFWSGINRTQLGSLLKIPSLKKFISENPNAAVNLSGAQAIDLFSSDISNVLVTRNHELLNKIPESVISILISNPNINKVGLAQNKSLGKLNETFLDPTNANFIFKTNNQNPNQFKILISENRDLFNPNNSLSQKVKKRLANQFILSDFNVNTHPQIITPLVSAAFLNPELIKFITKSKVMLFCNKYDVTEYLTRNPEIVTSLSRSNIESLIVSGSSFSKNPGSISALMSNSHVIKKLGTVKINKFINDYLDVNNRTPELEEVIIGLIKNNDLVLSYNDISTYTASSNVKIKGAIASRTGVENLLTNQEILELFNTSNASVRASAMSNPGLFKRFLSL